MSILSHTGGSDSGHSWLVGWCKYAQSNNILSYFEDFLWPSFLNNSIRFFKRKRELSEKAGTIPKCLGFSKKNWTVRSVLGLIPFPLKEWWHKKKLVLIQAYITLKLVRSRLNARSFDLVTANSNTSNSLVPFPFSCSRRQSRVTFRNDSFGYSAPSFPPKVSQPILNFSRYPDQYCEICKNFVKIFEVKRAWLGE